MKLKYIDYGCPEQYRPCRKHPNDVGADVYAIRDGYINPHQTTTIGLGFGVEIPIGYAGFIFTRSSLAKKGINTLLPPIDPGYTGEIHVMIYNGGYETYSIHEGDRIGQLVIVPAVTPEFVEDLGEERKDGAFGSTGK